MQRNRAGASQPRQGSGRKRKPPAYIGPSIASTSITPTCQRLKYRQMRADTTRHQNGNRPKHCQRTHSPGNARMARPANAKTQAHRPVNKRRPAPTQHSCPRSAGKLR